DNEIKIYEEAIERIYNKRFSNEELNKIKNMFEMKTKTYITKMDNNITNRILGIAHEVLIEFLYKDYLIKDNTKNKYSFDFKVIKKPIPVLGSENALPPIDIELGDYVELKTSANRVYFTIKLEKDKTTKESNTYEVENILVSVPRGLNNLDMKLYYPYLLFFDKNKIKNYILNHIDELQSFENHETVRGVNEKMKLSIYFDKIMDINSKEYKYIFG
ncbi:MAG: hypothetical protein ACP5IV_07750, partial [Caldisericia bacterium]